MRPWVLPLTVLWTLAAIAAGNPASAHTRSESHSAWELNGTHIDLIVTAIPDLEVQRLAPGDHRPSDEMVEGYLAARIFPISGGLQCPISPPIQVMSATPGYRKFDFTFACDADKAVQIHSDAFYDVVPSHVNFAQIQNAKGDFSEQLLTADHRTADVSTGSDGPLQKGSFHRIPSAWG